ncbi:SusC/RagA family TonB-linked outer membrane protein [Pedobacter sp. MC2016-15]|uniref:SusC/RagA family TonB-linked outer membrane protein n=1 Tax=Pedobacter sp. MC2016-15 TaxID=2994473 RepID=UPI002246274C|nr:SusC/RagA family TonB-linked outer membrane protein [Pedobacter sp. MC2016-15]MCX2477784.1 SusC/RagA family TonB-linked outer membrane protein [Pedobacter sp. MC2016-15]
MKFYTKLSGCPKGGLYKFLLIMRLITILIFAGIMHVSAGTYGQRITLNQKGITLKQIFKEIKRQTGYDVLWQKGNIDITRVIDAHFNNTSIAEVMATSLKEQKLLFDIQDESIVIKSQYVTSAITNSLLMQDSIVYKGTITDENGKPMAGATVKVKDSRKVTYTTLKGTFAIYGPKKGGSLIISYIGYLTKEITLSGVDANQVSIKMVPGSNNLGEVNVVSTGYQDLPKERATGSFEVITKEQLQHSTDPNLLRRLEGITTSMNFNNQLTAANSSNQLSVRGPSTLSNLTIRGITTLPRAANEDTGVPLVVIDGIATPYSIDYVNPNEVESITILKDAASASIWGSRAANGVIVVKTKRGGYNKPITVSFNSNFNISEKLDLFYNKYMSTSEFIDAEVKRFYNNNTNVTIPTIATITTPQRRISPVDEILGQQKRGETTQSQTDAALNLLRENDIRKDYTKYFLRSALRQSYSLGVDGGSKNISYRLSVGYDNTLNNTKQSDANRITVNYSTGIRIFKKLELQTNIAYSLQNANNQALNNGISGTTNETFYPYTRLADNAGNPLSVPKTYRKAWVDLFESTYGNKVLSLQYKPLEDIKEGYYKNKFQNINLGLNAVYSFNSVFSGNVAYNYSAGLGEDNTLYRENSFYMRDLINQYTTPNTFVRNLPLGGFLNTGLRRPKTNTLRGQLNVNKSWGSKHTLSGIIGVDISQLQSKSTFNNYYGYNEDQLSNVNQLTYNTRFSLLYTNSSGLLSALLPGLPQSFSSVTTRTIGTYANAAYTYNRRYTVSASIRRDASSDFGVGSNKGGVPFFSTGLSWNITNEDFYTWSFLPRLQLRSTYGYNGNVNPAVSAYPLILKSPSFGDNGLPFATTLSDASNFKLRPEKTGVLNLGLDFGFRNNRISGSIEFYDKQTTDLLSEGIVDPTTGYRRLTYNTANMHGSGVDLILNSINLQRGNFSWSSAFLFSYNQVKVTKLFSPAAANVTQGLVGAQAYNEGYNVYRLFALRWAGLDPSTGDPRGYLNGQVVSISGTSAGSQAYNNILAAPLSTARYFGSSVPVYFGSLRNSFSYKSFSISANLLYKLGYYFRKTNPVSYTQLFTQRVLQRSEYTQRWQTPGDELKTNVPSLTFPISSARDEFYQFSDINVLKADHVRLQEIICSYGLNRKDWAVKNLRLYFNVSNLGIVWRANKYGIDPDINDYPTPRTYSFGLSANF